MENLTLSTEVKLLVQLRPKEEGSTGRQRKPLHNEVSLDSAIFSADSKVLLRKSDGMHPSDENSISSSGFAGEPVIIDAACELRKSVDSVEKQAVDIQMLALKELADVPKREHTGRKFIDRDSGLGLSVDSTVLLASTSSFIAHPSDDMTDSVDFITMDPITLDK
ncbi:uncharacterized protein LOC127848734 isoform X1 [Dreissena polymorpha]|uniref:uncharacterized protein LOC127848734 isoform X1 n=1 Tax=Dreissena polymorpha TaxID=45954 RepID=UPI002264A76C|nr:uncharacterized protein LOC127848734 isoform X1 [Dreissena polymorpha]